MPENSVVLNSCPLPLRYSRGLGFWLASSVMVSVTTALAPASMDRWIEAPSRDHGPAATTMGFFSFSPIYSVLNDIAFTPIRFLSSKQLINGLGIAAAPADL